jgi:hypothetical protein
MFNNYFSLDVTEKEVHPCKNRKKSFVETAVVLRQNFKVSIPKVLESTICIIAAATD